MTMGGCTDVRPRDITAADLTSIASMVAADRPASTHREAAMAQRSDRIQPAPSASPQAALTLFCIPHAGGGGSTYRRWSEALGPALDVRVLQLAGRETRFGEVPSDDLAAVVADLWRAVARAVDRPYALFGHSLGGLLAFELAHEIQRRGGPPPVRLFISACKAPQLRQISSPFSALPDAAFCAEVAARYGGIPAPILENAEYLAAILPALRADVRIVEHYRCPPRDRLSCPISVFGGSADAIVPLMALAGWSDQTSDTFSLDMLEGDHFYLQTQRLTLARMMLAKLGPQLAACRRNRIGVPIDGE